MNRLRFLAMAVLLTLIAAGSAMGQMGQAGPGPNCPPACPRAFGPQMEANYENLRLLKLFEAVDLSDEQSAKFLPIFRAYRKDIKELRQQRADLIDRIAAAVADSSSESTLRAKMDTLYDIRNAIPDRETAFRREAAPMLTFVQQAKLEVFQERFEREVLESLREFRQQNARGAIGKK
ncbi:MAG: hypothetical protein PHR28_09945 [candidate division Zixibacteria bacterium]|nr:hypothetical protein [candidate division Zixibacteria bacterium]